MAINPFRKGGTDTIPISEGGTGAVDAVNARANLGAGDLTTAAHALINHTGVPGIPGLLKFEIHELTWSGSTLALTTPSFSFTPVAAIIIGALQNSGTGTPTTMSIGFATGTDTGSTPTNRQVGVGTQADNNGSDNDDVVAYDVNDVIGSLMSNRSVGSLVTNFTQQTGTPTRIRVTQFNASGIQLSPAGGTITGKAFLLVMGV